MIRRLIKRLVALTLISLLASCNEPPLYGKNAKAFLGEKGESLNLIENLTRRRAIDESTAKRLSNYDNIAVLHLLGANPGTPEIIIRQLSQHKNLEVRTGVAVNPATPIDVLTALRTKGKYTTVNTALASNPILPKKILWEMYRQEEALASSFAMNPNCPVELMWDIFRTGSEQDRTWLAYNRNLPPELMQVLETDSSKIVKNYLQSNPTYQKWKSGD